MWKAVVYANVRTAAVQPGELLLLLPLLSVVVLLLLVLPPAVNSMPCTPSCAAGGKSTRF